jgi:beta-galactosidase
MALHTIAANKQWRDPAARAEYQRSMERVMRRFRNHPSIMMWGTTANWIGHEQDQNPRLIGTQAFAEQNTGEVTRTAAREQVAMMKKADPTRPIFFHHGTNIADFSTVNSYLNLIPLQEREEWLSEWAKRPDSQPWWAVEFGLPLDITLMRGRSNDVSVFVERLFTENMATYLGHDAYLRETDLMWHLNRNDFDDPAGENFRKSNLPRDVWPVGGYQHWFITRDKMGGLDFAYPPYQDFMTLFVRNTYRSWRTWGSTSLPMPWGFPARMKFAGDKDSKVKLPAFQPGRIGTWVEEVPQQAMWSVEGKQGEEAPITRAMREANSETLAWITGPAQAFTAKDHSFWAGSKLQKQVALLNDTRAPQRYKLRWTVRVGQKVVEARPPRVN